MLVWYLSASSSGAWMYGGSGVSPAFVQKLEQRRGGEAGEQPAAVAQWPVAAQRPHAGALAGQHLSGTRPAAQEPLPGLAVATRTPQVQKQHFDASPVGAPKEAACREHARIVAHEHVAWAQQGRQIAERTILPAPGGAMEDQETRGVARFERLLRDKLRRQLVVQIIERQVVASPGSSRRAAARRSCHASHLLGTQPQ